MAARASLVSPDSVTHGRVLKIALPIALSNASVPLLGAVDTAVVGQIGQAAPIGAVGLGAVILSSLYWIFGFLRMGTTALVAQARGAKEAQDTGALFARGLVIAGGGALLLILGQALLFAGALWIAPASAAVEALTGDYLAIRIWGAPAAIALFVVTGWLVAQERTGAVLVLQLWMNGLNIALNFAFVLGLGWGVTGVAWASLIAEWSGLALGLWLCRAVFEGGAWRDSARILDPARLRRMLAVNRDILLRNLAITLASAGFLFLSSGLGDVKLAANQVLMQFFALMAFALDGFAYAAETLVGQAVGARDRARLGQTVRIVLIWGMIGAVLLALIFWALGPWIIALMTTAPEVRAAAETYLIWLILIPLAATWSFMLDGIFFGATWTRDLLIAMAQSVAIYGVALAVFLPLWGNHGLWAAMAVFSLARVVTLGRRYPGLAGAV